jgi:hypothetical protein
MMREVAAVLGSVALCIAAGIGLATWAACVDDEPVMDAREDQEPPKGALVVEVLLHTCDLRHAGARCRSNDVCGICDVGGFDVWYWRADKCTWALTNVGETPNTEAQSWDVCGAFGPMDRRTSTP